MHRLVTLAVIPVLALGLVACGDDGNDVALQQQRAAELAAQFRASQTTSAPILVAAPISSPPASANDPTAEPPASTEPPATTVPPVEPTGVVVSVVALDNSFRPNLIEIAVGDEVLWENRGLNEHNVLEVEGEDWGVTVENFQPGAVYAHVFTEPGEYHYYCSIHGNENVGMVGTVVVAG
jgi:plastocyanin